MTNPDNLPPAPPPGGGADFSDSDQAWFDRLSGNSTGPALKAAEREADVLRSALDAREAAKWAKALDPAESERQRQRVHQNIAQARAASAAAREQAAPAPPAAPAPSVPRAPTAQPGLWSRWRDALLGGGAAWPPRWGAAGALAGVVGIALVLGPLRATLWGPEPDLDGPPLRPGPVSKGGADARVQRSVSPTPRRSAEALAAALRVAGLQPGVYRDADAPASRVVLVDVDIDAEQLDAAGRVFEQHGLRRPALVGLARVVFEKTR